MPLPGHVALNTLELIQANDQTPTPVVIVLLVKLPAYTLQPDDIDDKFIVPLLNMVTPFDVVAACAWPKQGYVPLSEVTFISVLFGAGNAAALYSIIDDDAFIEITPLPTENEPDCEG